MTVVALLWAGAGVARREIPNQPFSRRETAQWLAAHIPAGSPVMLRDSELGLYSGLPVIALPNADVPQVLAYGRARGARYMVIEEAMVKSLRPQLAPFLDTAHPVPGTTFLAELSAAGSARTLVYRLEGTP